jgi:pimeloyl-ACP methyl ester carboxylesterase
MNHLKQKYLFFHYGPGGNASLERIWLKDLMSKVDFWDLPHSSLESVSFESMIKVALDKFRTGSYRGIIGHSFGCDIALKVAELAGKQIEDLVLISPIRNIPAGFVALAQKLSSTELDKSRQNLLQTVSSELVSVLNKSSSTTLLSSETLPIFFKLVQAIATDPSYYKVYWKQLDKLSFYEKHFSETIPMDFTVWQTLLSKYFLESSPKFEYPFPGTVIFGENDPYYIQFLEEKKHWEKLHFKVLSTPDAGHYPHLESELLSKAIKLS